MLKIGWFSTGRGPGSRNLLKAVMDRIQSGYLDAEIGFVFCNWDNTETPNLRRDQRRQFFEQVRGYGIPLVTESFRDFNPELRELDKEEWGKEYGKALREKTAPYGTDVGVLAGYMLWVDDATCAAYDMLNLHPALPDGPKGTWQQVIWKLIEDGATEQGAMIHIVTPEHDRGAPLTFCRFPIRGGGYDALWDSMEEKLRSKPLEKIREEEGEEEPLFRRIREDGARRELPLIVETLRLLAEGTVRIEGKALWKDGERLDGPYDLSAEVDGELRCRTWSTPCRTWGSWPTSRSSWRCRGSSPRATRRGTSARGSYRAGGGCTTSSTATTTSRPSSSTGTTPRTAATS